MFAQIDYIWVIIGTVITCAGILTLALYIVYRNRSEITAKERELAILKEKHEVESQLQQASRMAIIGALAGGMAYYLNSTLFAIRSLMEMMKNEQGTKKSISQLSSLAAAEITRGLKVTDQLQQLAHPQKLALRPLSVTELVVTISDNLKHRFQKSIKIKVICNQDKNIVLGDRILLQQVLVNLITNAADAMPDGGVITISVSDTSRLEKMGTGAFDKTKRDLVICVSDTGCGMDEETKRQVFEPFFTTKMLPERLGLGLSFAYGITKIHNGRILIESEKNQGITVSLYIPIPSPDQLEYSEKQELGDEDLTLDLRSLEERLALLQQEVGQA